MYQQRPHLGDGHLRLFFPPTAAVAASGATGPAAIGPYGGANPPTPASRTRPAHIPLWPLENFARPTSAPLAPEPTSPAGPPRARWSDGTSTRPAGPAIDVPASVPVPRAVLPR